MKKSETSFLIIEIGCSPPRCLRLTGKVISTTSSSKTFLSRSASSFSVAVASACAIAAFASPIILPKLAFSSGDKDPSPLEAREIGALSPAWAKRAALRESKSVAAPKATWASLTHCETSSWRIERTLSCESLGRWDIC